MAKKKKKSIIDYKDVLAIPFSQVNEFDNGFTYANNKNIYTEFNDGKFISHDGLDKCIDDT